MPKGVSVGNLSADGSLYCNVEGLSADLYSLLLTGGFGGGDLAIKGGDGTVFEAVRISDPSAGVLHSNIEMSAAGLYTFRALCARLEFELSGSAGPDLDITIFPAPRGYHGQ